MLTKFLLLLFAIAISVSGVNSSSATILVFDVSPFISGQDVPQDYGDRVTGKAMSVPRGEFTYDEAGEGFTPNITAEYFVGSPSLAVSLWNNDYGDLTNVLFNACFGEII